MNITICNTIRPNNVIVYSHLDRNIFYVLMYQNEFNRLGSSAHTQIIYLYLT